MKMFGYLFSFDAYLEMEEFNKGACVNCGTWQEHCGPDAQALKCDCCKQFTVYGSAELLKMGRVEEAETEIV